MNHLTAYNCLSFISSTLVIMLLCSTVNLAQDYYFESYHQKEGFGAYSSAEAKALVPDGQGNYVSCHDSWFGQGKARIIKVDSNSNELWSKTIGKALPVTADIRITNLNVDKKGDIYVYGYTDAAIDADPGAGSYILPLAGHDGYYFMIKLATNGAFLWATILRYGAHTSGTPGNLAARTWIQADTDSSGNHYVASALKGTYDLDPDTSVYNLTSLNSTVILQKIDTQGTLIWVKQLHNVNASNNHIRLLETDAQANVYIIGYFEDSVDFDPSPNSTSYLYTSTGAYFLLKLDKDGVFQWVQGFDYGEPQNVPLCMTIVPSGSIYIGGAFKDTIDADPSSSSNILISQGQVWSDFYLLKFGANGSFDWAHKAGGAYEDKLVDIFYHNGRLTCLGNYGGTGDIALGTRVDTTFDAGCFFQTIDTTGNHQSTYVLPAQMVPRKIRVEDNETVFIAGGYGLGDFDPSAGIAHLDDGVGGSDFIFLKLSRDSCKAFNITAENVKYFACQDTGIASVTPQYGLGAYQYNWGNGSTDSLFYYDTVQVVTVTVTDARGCSKQTTIYLEGAKDTAGLGVDVEPYLHGAYDRMRPGQTRIFTLEGVNHNCTPADGYLYIVLDSAVNYVGGGSTPPDSIIGDTLFWNYTNLTHDYPLLLTFGVQVDSSIIWGTSVSYKVGMYATTIELDSSNNFKQYNGLIINSYDPNRKIAYPEGVCAAKLIEKKEKIRYTIEFQNTGTTYAVNVKITDTLSPLLNLNSLDIISSSHNYRLGPIVDNTLDFYFDFIYLLDSATNEPASHGYITFEIEVDQNTLGELLVDNKVQIFFDLNPPIVTNTVSRTFVDSIVVPDDSISLINGILIAQQDNANYQWVDCNNNNAFLVGETGQSFLPTQNGRYAVLVEYSTCTVLSSCFDYAYLQTASLSNQEALLLFPNPTTGLLHLQSSSEQVPITIRFYDVWGRVVVEQLVNTSTATINIQQLPTGIYHVTYSSQEEQGSMKIIKTD